VGVVGAFALAIATGCAGGGAAIGALEEG